MRRRTGIALLLPLLAAFPAHAADAASETPGTATPAVAPEQWGGEPGYAILAKDERGLRVSTPIGPVRIGTDLVKDVEAFPVFADLIKRAKAAGLDGTELTFSRSPLTGLRLGGESVLVTSDGVLRRLPLSPAPRDGDLSALRDSAAKAAGALPDRLSPLARKTLGALLTHLADPDDPELEQNGIDPAVARRLARAGFLRAWLGDGATAIAHAAEAALAPSEVVSWRGEGCALDELVDAFGHRLWTLHTSARTVLLTPAVLPRQYPRARFEKALLRVELPASADAVTPSDADITAASASLWVGGSALVRWSPSEGFACDEKAWRAQFSDHPRGYEHPVAGYLPPHLAVRDGSGAVRLLVTAHGAVRPPNGDSADGERFLAAAAAALPDAAHLGLVGHYLFSYCYDSPDPREPLLLGTLDDHGDIHQTAAQTLATAVGGRLRGDCDDLAELFEALCVRQRRNPIVISLPRHLACAYAEKQDDGWRVCVLHTGHPLEFVDRELPQALAAMYKSFDQRATIDTTQISLSLRFAGENTRTHWRLSWRIFAEPDYARTMIEVQRDWYFRTYQRGITTMQGLIAAGDQDTANYEELCGLYRSTGQWGESVRYARQALQRLKGDTARLDRSIELVSLLTRAQRHDEAAQLARRISEQDLPRLASTLRGGVPRLANRLAGGLDGARDPDLCLEILQRWSVPGALAAMPPLRAWIRDHFDRRAWEEDPQLTALCDDAGGTLAAAQGALDKLGVRAAEDEDGVADCLRLDQAYLADIAFRGDDPGTLAHAYAYAGWYYELVLGRPRLRALLAQTAMPSADPGDHAERVDGIAQLWHDLPWIKASVPYWWSAVSRDLWGERGAGPADVPTALLDLDQLQRAAETAQALGMTSRHQVATAAQARLLAALLKQDAVALDAALDAVAADHDRQLTQDAATLIGQAAKVLPAAWFDRVLAGWRDRVDSKPFYLCIAWTALINDADERALAAARLAAQRFADDPAFAEESALIEQRVAARKQIPARTGAPPEP